MCNTSSSEHILLQFVRFYFYIKSLLSEIDTQTHLRLAKHCFVVNNVSHDQKNSSLASQPDTENMEIFQLHPGVL